MTSSTHDYDRSGGGPSLLLDAELAEIRRVLFEGWAMFQFGMGFLSSIEAQLAGVQRAARSPRLHGEPVRLSPREADVLRLAATGLRNDEIGQRLHISGGTVKNYMTAILAKLQARTRWEAVLRAQALGLM